MKQERQMWKMRVKAGHSLKTIMFGFVEGLGFFPVLLLLAALCLNQKEILIWFLGLMFVFLINFFIRCLLRDRWRHLSFIGAAVIVPIYSFLFFDSMWAKGMTLFIGLVVAYRGIQYAEIDREQLVQSQIKWVISLPLYFVGYIVFALTEHLVMYKNWISIAGVLYICMMVLMTNEQLLHRATFSKEKQKKVGSEVKRLNRIYLFMIILVILFISNFYSIQSAIYFAVKYLLGLLLDRKGSDKPVVIGKGQTVRPQFHLSKTKPSHMPAWLDNLFWIIAILIAVVFCVVMAVILIRKFKSIIRRLFSWIIHLFAQILKPRYRQDPLLEYEDEKVSLFDIGKLRGEVKENIQEFFRNITKARPKFEQMTMEEKVRFLYRSLAGEVKQQEKWRASLTAHEVLQLNERKEQLDHLKKWYDDIRYGKKPLNESEMNQVEEFWLRIRQ